MTRSSFGVPEIVDLFRGAPFPWWIAGGRGLELFAGHELRDHEDLDVAVLRPDEARIRGRLEGWNLRVVNAANQLVPWTEPLAAGAHAVWCRPAGADHWAFELLFNDVEGSAWRFRRDHRIYLPLSSLGGSDAAGTPYLAPEVILLYKAKRVRERDREDFEAVAPLLADVQRRWLRRAIARVHPGHAWLERLA